MKPDETIEPAVLVVDDDIDLRGLLSVALRRAGLEVVEASSGEAALRLLEATPISVVVCDLGMPGMSGLDVVRELRRRSETATLPFLLMTGSGDGDSVIEALAAGADDFLAKPVRLEELVARVRAHLRNRAAWTEVVSTELRARSEAVQAIGRLALSAVAQEAAGAVVAELANRTGAEFVGVLQVTAGGRVLPLARYNRHGGVVIGGSPLTQARSRYLVDRARQGPWSERVSGPEPGEPVDPFWEAGLEFAGVAPVYVGGDIVAILSLGIEHEDGGLAPALREANLLASVIDYANILGAVAGPRLADRRSTDAEVERLRQILKDREFSPVYQPIVALRSRQAIGYEALTRFADGTPPNVRFAEAGAVGLGEDFELAAIEAALAGASPLPADAFLTLNVSPYVLMTAHRRLERIVRSSPRRIVVEVTEHAAIPHYERFRERVARIGDVDLAVDDAGAGHASLRHILELRPAFAKLDRSLVSGIDADPLRQAMASGLAFFASRTNCRLIAEGVEREAEAEVLEGLGIELAQGYLFGRPERAVNA